MIEVLNDSNERFKQKGWPELVMGVGVNTDNVVVGNMGSKDRLNYTVIGDGVNLAPRLESISKNYDVPVIISEATTYKHLILIMKNWMKSRLKARKKLSPSIHRFKCIMF